MSKVVKFPGKEQVKSLISEFHETHRIEDLLSVFEYCMKNNLSQSEELAELDIYHLDFKVKDSFVEYSKFLFDLSVTEAKPPAPEKPYEEPRQLPEELLKMIEDADSAMRKRDEYIQANVDRDYLDFYSAYDLYPVLKFIYDENSDPAVLVGQHLEHYYYDPANPAAYLKNESAFRAPNSGKLNIPNESKLHKLLIEVGQNFIKNQIPDHKDELNGALSKILDPYPSGKKVAETVSSKQLIAILLTNEYFAAKWVLGYFLAYDIEGRPVSEEQFILLMVLYSYQWEKNNLRDHFNSLVNLECFDYLQTIEQEELIDVVFNYYTFAFAVYQQNLGCGVRFSSETNKNISKSFFNNLRKQRLKHDGRSPVDHFYNIELSHILWADMDEDCYDWPIILSFAVLDDSLYFGVDSQRTPGLDAYKDSYIHLINKAFDEGLFELSNAFFALFLLTHLIWTEFKLTEIHLINLLVEKLRGKTGWHKYSAPAIHFAINCYREGIGDSKISEKLDRAEIENYIFQLSRYVDEENFPSKTPHNKSEKPVLLEKSLVNKLHKEAREIFESTETIFKSVEDLELSDWGTISIGYFRIMESALKAKFKTIYKKSKRWTLGEMVEHLKRYEFLSEPEKKKINDVGLKLHQDKDLLSVLTQVVGLRNTFSHGGICDAVQFKTLRTVLFNEDVFWRFLEKL